MSLSTHRFLIARVTYLLSQRLNWLWPCLGVVILWALLLLITPWIPAIELPSGWWWSVDTLGGQLWTLVLELFQGTIDAVPFLILFGTMWAGTLWLMWKQRPTLGVKQRVVAIFTLAYFFLMLQMCVSLLDAVYITLSGTLTPDIMLPFLLFDMRLLCMVVLLLVCSIHALALPGKVLISGVNLSHAYAESKQISKGNRTHFFLDILLYECGIFVAVSFILDYLLVVPGVIQFLCLLLLAMWMFGRYVLWYENLTKTWNR